MAVTDSNLGEWAALGAAMCWVFTSLAFAAAGRRVGPGAVNLIRLVLAVMIIACIHHHLLGQWWPSTDSPGLWWLAASGALGLAIGDQLLFTALVDVGPRIATLLMTLAPPTAALLAWPALREPLTVLSTLGITITVIGIAWVVRERPTGTSAIPHRHRTRGILFGALAGICQAAGLVMAKLGIGHTRLPAPEHLDPWSATLIRMVFATITMVCGVAAVRLLVRRNPPIEVSVETEHLPPEPRRARVDLARFRDRWGLALPQILLGAIFGPVLGVWLSLVAVDLAPAGIAATLMAMSPVFILPFAVWIERERLTPRAVIGAMVAVAGVIVLTAVN